MRWPFEVAGVIGVLVIVACTIHYFWTMFFKPEYAAALEAEDDWHRTLLGNWLYYGYHVAAFVSTAFCIFQGTVTVLHWIPQSWVSFIVDESERNGFDSSLAILVAFFGSAGLVSGLSTLSNRIAREQMEVRRLSFLLQETQKPKLDSKRSPD
jgi:hypothetical protein